jgi:hypothetical protein
MASFSNFLENALLNRVFNGAALSLPSTLYIGLFTAAPTDAGGGTEVSGNNYSRLAVPADTTNFPTSTSGSVQNALTLTFAIPSGNWGTVTHIGIFDAATAGNLLVWGALSSPRVITSSADVRLNQNQLTITLD